MPDLIPILLPRKEVQQRLVMARQSAKAARVLVKSVVQFGRKDARDRAKIIKYTEQAEEAEAIVASCLAGLQAEIIVASNGQHVEELPDPDPTREEGVTESAFGGNTFHPDTRFEGVTVDETGG